MLHDDELRVLGISAPVLVKLLENAEARIVNTMCGDFSAGKLEQVANLARLAALRELKTQINSAQSALSGRNP